MLQTPVHMNSPCISTGKRTWWPHLTDQKPEALKKKASHLSETNQPMESRGRQSRVLTPAAASFPPTRAGLSFPSPLRAAACPRPVDCDCSYRRAQPRPHRESLPRLGASSQRLCLILALGKLLLLGPRPHLCTRDPWASKACANLG